MAKMTKTAYGRFNDESGYLSFSKSEGISISSRAQRRIQDGKRSAKKFHEEICFVK